MRVFDLWESGDHFNRFVAERLMPAVREIGIEGDPEVTLCEVHRMFAPKEIHSGAGLLV
jgi:hypothetical protein